MTTLIFGAAGFLGQQLLESLPNAVGSSVDIADASAVRRAIEDRAPEIVVNCAGKTGRPNVDWCESHREETVRSNVTGALVLLDECQKRRLYLVHLSTGCLFQGDNNGRGFAEDDPPNFAGSYYVRTKVHADQILAEFPVLILRPRMPFDDSLHERTLLGKLRKYERVLDTANSLTYIPDFLTAARQLIDERRTGIYHVVNPGVTTPFEVMCRYREIVEPEHHFGRLSVDQLTEVTTAARSSCTLSTDKLQACGITIQPVSAAIETALTAIARAAKG